MGIYLECLPREKTVQKWVNCICKNGHQFYAKTEFCQKCGQPLKDVYKDDHIQNPMWSDIGEMEFQGKRLNDLLMQSLGEKKTKFEYLRLNLIKHPYGKEYGSEACEVYEIDTDTAEETGNFMNTYKALIEFLTTQYFSVEVKYGLIIDWN